MGSSPPVNNFGQPISQKPFVHARVIGNRKVVTETAPHDPFVIFTIQTESNLEEYASNKKNGKGDYLWYLPNFKLHRFRSHHFPQSSHSMFLIYHL